MSIAMNLEAEVGVSDADVHAALVACGVYETVGSIDGFKGNFPLSNMFFAFNRADADHSRIRAEGYEEDWMVGCRCTFVYVVANFDECRRQMRQFLEELTSLTSANWVLTFQYEAIYAARDGRGVRYSEEL